MKTDIVATFNQRTFRRPELVREYADWQWIEGGEERLLREVTPRVRDGDVLELGVGAGRLVPELCRLGAGYVGIDYSPEMVAACRDKFPGLSFLCCDARDLRVFESGRFALAVFSFNGLDYVSHEDRIVVLSEIWRVLSTDGSLIFSSHNLESSLYPKHNTSLREVYSIVHEKTGDFCYQCYYVRRGEVLRQLRSAGFRGDCVFYNRDGGGPGPDARSGWLHYLARK